MWVPANVPADWAPYRDGQWTWTEPWGWTWVDIAVWGFSPSHYGRWTYVNHRWGWLPGRYAAHPIYAPAIVGWIHSDPGPRSAVLGLPIGWFPLGPHETYTPSYSASPSYIRSINLSHVPVTRMSGAQAAQSKPDTGAAAASGRGQGVQRLGAGELGVVHGRYRNAFRHVNAARFGGDGQFVHMRIAFGVGPHA